MKGFFPPGYSYGWHDVPQFGTHVEEMIPSEGTVLLFGPAGTGKTTFVANMLNAVASNQQFLGRNTTTVNGMLLSCDTPQNIIIRRWVQSGFKPQFAFAPQPAFDCLHPDFTKSQMYTDIQQKIIEHDIKLVAVDSLRDIFHGDLNNDELPKRIYDLFQTWFMGATVVFIHHTRKAQVFQGQVVNHGGVDDEATGSKFWINKAQVALHLRKENSTLLKLNMGKSQCFEDWENPIRVLMEGMDMGEYNATSEAKAAAQYQQLVAQLSVSDPAWSGYSASQKDEAIALAAGVKVRTVYRWKTAVRNTALAGGVTP